MSFDDSPMRANLDGSPMRVNLVGSPMQAKLLYARRNFSHVAICVQSANLSSNSLESEISCPAHPCQGAMVDLKDSQHQMMDLDPPDQSFKEK